MAAFRWSAVFSLLGALLTLIGTIFHPPLTNPWDTSFAFNGMAHHHHWILDHCIFFLWLTFWLLGLSYLGDLHNSSHEQTSSGGRIASQLFIGSLIMWMIILAAEIAVLPPLVDKITVHDDGIAREIWNALFTWGLFSGYLAMGLVYIGIILLGIKSNGLLKVFGRWTGFIGIIGVASSLLLPNAALIIQLTTAPLPFLWTVWFLWRNLKKQ